MDSSIIDTAKKLISRIILKLNKPKIKTRALVFLIIFIMLGGLAYSYHKKNVEHEINTRAFKVIVEDSEIGVVRDKEKVQEIIKSIQDELSKDFNMEVSIDCKITYKDTHAEDDELTSFNELRDNIKSKLDYNVWAYAILVNGKEFGVLKTKEQAEDILSRIKEPYLKVKDKDVKYELEEVKFAENVQIVKKEVSFSQISDPEKILAILKKGTDEERIHKVEKGESFWSIAHKYNLTVEDLIKANPDKNPELIHPGDELSLIIPKPYITVVTVEKVTYEGKTEFGTEYQLSSNMYNDEAIIKRKGIPGKSLFVAKVEKHNGIEMDRVILKETILSKPVNQIVLKGTKEPPPKKGTGVFINPLPVGRLTSRFGIRWGRMHNGIDLAARTGTPIKAADGGVVTYAGWRGNYGYLVEIDHGGGFKTRYGHCSKIYVKVGQKVYKGKIIAAVGNTGRSTGPHVHFEVLKYDKPVNPYNYIGKRYR
jgi:murein DD-endopeptidase MepM/ murein hydrolase activator NlpD